MSILVAKKKLPSVREAEQKKSIEREKEEKRDREREKKRLPFSLLKHSSVRNERRNGA